MNAFEEAYNHLNSDQKAAVDHIDGPLLVIAGPGTGKTQLLSVRVANILKQTDATAENILCLTFTETGASNMRHRLADFIGADAYKVQIQTYHAFGSYILSEHRPDLNSAIDELGQFTLIRQIQSELDPTDILRPEHYTKAIISAISDLKSAALTAEDVRKIVNRNEIDNGLIYAAISEDIQATKGLRYPKAMEVYNRILDSLKTFVDRDDINKNITDKIEPLCRIYYRELAEAILSEENSEKPSTKAMGKWREKFFKKDKNDRFVFGDIYANKKLLSLANIMDRYNAHLKANGMFDYDDMILQAISLLENDDEKRFNAQERFQYILLDEFQDTNDAQAKLVSLLTDNPNTDWQPNIMAVGDDDQAIYGFQGANTSNFFDFDAKYHPKHIFLTKNYRSSKPILDFAHNIIEQSDDRFCKAPGVEIDKRITAENPPAETKIELREFKAFQSEYTFVAQRIKHLIDEEHVPGNKISIIAPKHKYLVSILPYLHSLGIPVAYTKRENILENEHISSLIDFCNLILAISHNNNQADQYWFRTLSLPCWNLTPETIIKTIHDAKAEHRSILDELLASENETLKEIANFAVSLAGKVDVYSAEFIINSIVSKIFTETDNYELYSNLNTLRNILLSKNSGKLKLRNFCELVAAHQAAEIQILDKSPYRESDDAVVLQTVHSSKGLEYEHVFLIAADNKNWSDASGNNDLIVLPRNLEHVRHTGDSAAEKIRVLFVAITRAKAKLYLTYSTSDFAGHAAEPLKFLDQREENDQICSKVIPEPYQTLIRSDTDAISPDAIAPNKWFDSYIPTDEVRKNLLKPYVEHYRISPTHLNTFIDLRYGEGPEDFLKRYIIGAPGDTSFALNYGKYVHEIMDEINREDISNEEAMQRFVRKIEDADADEEEKKDLIKRGEAELSKFLTEKGDLLRNTHADSERGFFSENIVLDDDTLLTGKIDRIEIDEEHKTITVSDFKTGKPKDKWSNNDATFGYKIQLYFYKFLLENSRDYRNYTVTNGRIDYVSPDDDGDIVSLELKFNEKENSEIKTLIKNVFRSIKALDFPDTTEAKKSYNPTKAFYDQLINL